MLLLIIYRNDISYEISPWLSYFVVFYCKLTMNFSCIFIVVIVNPCEAREHDLVGLKRLYLTSSITVREPTLYLLLHRHFHFFISFIFYTLLINLPH